MSQTMLQMVQQVSSELGLVAPQTVAGNTSQDVIQILALMNAGGYELLKEHDWQALQQEYRFYTQAYNYSGFTTEGTYTISGMSSTVGLDDTFMVTGDNIQQDTTIVTVDSAVAVTVNQKSSGSGFTNLTFGKTKYALPPDFETITNRTQWDKSKHWEMLGPEDAQQWQWLKSGYISTGPRVRWRILDGQFQIWPIMNTQEYLGFEYRSNYWARSSTGVPKGSFTADNDTCIYDSRLMVLKTKLKYFQIKNFDTTSLQQDYFRVLNVVKANDKGAPNLSFAPYPSKVLIGYANIPDTGYGS